MNIDEIFVLPDLSLSQSFEELVKQMNEWKDKQFKQIEIIYNESIKKFSYFIKNH